MGLLDKLKNVFFEEEYVEVEEPEKIEPKEKVTVAKKIETPEMKRKEEQVLKEEPKEVNLEETKEMERPSREKEHRFPMNFDDKDFEVEKTIELEPVKEKKEIEIEEKEEPIVEQRTVEYRYEEYSYEEPVHESREEKMNNYQGLYEGGKERQEKQEKQEKSGFTPSPIISPIYGILNKNYKKDEIVSKREVRLSQTSTKKADLDVVREKAYGDLAGEISASIEEDLFEETKEPTNDIKEDLLYDLNDEESPTVKVVTVGDAEEYFNDLGLEYNVDYKVEREDAKAEKEERENNKISIDESSDDDKNLFDLIYSMYEDKE